MFRYSRHLKKIKPLFLKFFIGFHCLYNIRVYILYEKDKKKTKWSSWSSCFHFFPLKKINSFSWRTCLSLLLVKGKICWNVQMVLACQVEKHSVLATFVLICGSWVNINYLFFLSLFLNLWSWQLLISPLLLCFTCLLFCIPTFAFSFYLFWSIESFATRLSLMIARSS